MFYPCFFPSDNVWRFRCASVRALFYWFHTFLDHTTNISRKVRAPRRVSASGGAKQCSKWSLGQKKNMDNALISFINDVIMSINRLAQERHEVLMSVHFMTRRRPIIPLYGGLLRHAVHAANRVHFDYDVIHYQNGAVLIHCYRCCNLCLNF